jgi:hypothetical protein
MALITVIIVTAVEEEVAPAQTEQPAQIMQVAVPEV